MRCAALIFRQQEIKLAAEGCVGEGLAMYWPPAHIYESA